MSPDHKDVGRIYIGAALSFLVLGIVSFLLMRLQLGVPENNLIEPVTFNRLLSVGSATLVVLFGLPIAFGLYTYVIPLQIGARSLAFPRLASLSLWLYIFGGGILYASFPYTPPETGFNNWPHVVGHDFHLEQRPRRLDRRGRPDGPRPRPAVDQPRGDDLEAARAGARLAAPACLHLLRGGLQLDDDRRRLGDARRPGHAGDGAALRRHLLRPGRGRRADLLPAPELDLLHRLLPRLPAAGIRRDLRDPPGLLRQAPALARRADDVDGGDHAPGAAGLDAEHDERVDPDRLALRRDADVAPPHDSRSG